VLVIDDHEVVREGLSAALSCDGSFEVAAATAASGMLAAAWARPDVALVGVRLPDTVGAVRWREDPSALPGDRGRRPQLPPVRGYGPRFRVDRGVPRAEAQGRVWCSDKAELIARAIGAGAVAPAVEDVAAPASSV
jgi:hypothetical protein